MKRRIIKIAINNNNNEFDVECFFIDLDGTSLDKKNHSISDMNINKIRETIKNTPIVISTGRSFGDKVKELMGLLNIEYAICQNGAIIANKNHEILLDITIDYEMVKIIKETAIKYNLAITPNSQYRIYNSRWFMRPFVFFSKHYFALKDFDDTLKYNKLVLAGCSKKRLFKIFKELKNTQPSLSIKTSANDWIIEITDKKATKGLASIFVSDLLNVSPKKSVHIGDSMNDTTTINCVGALIAMENSSKHLLNVATHIGPNFKKGGLSKVLSGEFLENTSKK